MVASETPNNRAISRLLFPASFKCSNVTLEINEEYAKVAKQNIENAGYGPKVEVIVGNALDTLPNLKNAGLLFDFIFIDADKPNNPAYLRWALKLADSGALIIADNVVRNGEVTNENSEDERVRGVQEFMDLVKANPRVEATAIQTVGVKGYDGFVLAVVN